MRYSKTNSSLETKEVAQEFAKKFLNNEGAIIALVGDLGAGKTTFTQGFCEGLGIKEKVISPTFVLMRQHQLPQVKKNLFHIDLYRIEGKIDINNLGLKDIIDDEDSLVLIEWAEKIKDQLPQRTIFINIKKISDNQREILIEDNLVTSKDPSNEQQE